MLVVGITLKRTFQCFVIVLRNKDRLLFIYSFETLRFN